MSGLIRFLTGLSACEIRIGKVLTGVGIAAPTDLNDLTIRSHAVQGGINRPAGKLGHACYLGWPQELGGL